MIVVLIQAFLLIRRRLNKVAYGKNATYNLQPRLVSALLFLDRIQRIKNIFKIQLMYTMNEDTHIFNFRSLESAKCFSDEGLTNNDLVFLFKGLLYSGFVLMCEVIAI
jgi:hypothetical protein